MGVVANIKGPADRAQLIPASMANSSSLTGTGTAIYLVSGARRSTT